jgi:hypothetical protein
MERVTQYVKTLTSSEGHFETLTVSVPCITETYTDEDV